MTARRKPTAIRQAAYNLRWLQDPKNALALYAEQLAEREYASRRMASLRSLHPDLADQFDDIDQAGVA